MKKHFEIMVRSVLITAAVLFLCIRTGWAADPIASIQTMKGTVEMRVSDTGKWAAAKTGAPLAENSQVRAGADGEAIVKWKQGHIVKLYALSTLKIEKMSLKETEESSQVNIGGGKIFVKAQKLVSNKSNFTVKTPTAVAAVRGTEFMVEVAADNTSSIALLEGSLDVVTNAVEMVLSENMSLQLMPGMTEPPAPVEMSPAQIESLQAESNAVESESGGGAGGSGGSSSKSGGSGSSGGASSSTSSDSSSVDTSAVENVVSDVLNNATLTTDVVIPPTDTGSDVPPLPPDR